jgi:TRAP transporter TAXI family solute receptor
MMKRLPIAAVIASVVALAPPAVNAQQPINVLTGGTSGIYYPLGVALGKIYDETIPNVRTQVQATKASVENLILLEQGRGDIAFTIGDSLKAAWEGDDDAGFKTKLGKLRAIAAIYPNYIQLVATNESGIKTVTDLKGKRLSVGAPKSGTELNTRAILRGAGMSYADVRKVDYLPFAESVDLMKNRQLDATLQSAGLGVASVRDLSNAMEVTVVSVPKPIVDRMGPPFVPAKIPANTYKGQGKDVETAAVANYLVTHAGVSDDLVYQMTKALFESLSELAKAHEAGKGIKLETALAGVPVPLHPGAERYYQEKGLKK